MGVNRMTGTPWHVEVLRNNEGERKRHRSRCIYFDRKSKKCRKNRFNCFGSAHCDDYKEKDVAPTEDRSDAEATTHSESRTNAKRQTTPDVALNISIGDRIIHKRWGAGIVINIENDIIKLLFDDGNMKSLVFSEVVRNGLLKRE